MAHFPEQALSDHVVASQDGVTTWSRTCYSSRRSSATVSTVLSHHCHPPDAPQQKPGCRRRGAKLACPSSLDRPGLSFLSDATQTAYLAGDPCLCCEGQLTMVFVGWAPRHPRSHAYKFISGTLPQSKSTGQTTLRVMTPSGYKTVQRDPTASPFSLSSCL